MRRYVGSDAVPRIRSGTGVAVLSTSRGIFTDAQARAAGVAGNGCAMYGECGAGLRRGLRGWSCRELEKGVGYPAGVEASVNQQMLTIKGQKDTPCPAHS